MTLSVATEYGQPVASHHSPKAGTILQALQGNRGVLTAGLARRALGATEIEITAGAVAGLTLATDAANTLIPGDYFDMDHVGLNKRIRFYFTGVALHALGAMAVPAKANITNADFYYFTDPDGVITGIWFDTTGSETEPAALTAIIAAGAVGSAALEADISAATTAADVMAIIETALNAAAVGLTSDDTAADGTTILSVDARGAAGNSWVFTEAVADAAGTVTQPTGGVDDTIPKPPLVADYEIPVVILDYDADDADDVATAIALAIDTADAYLVANGIEATSALGLPDATAGSGIVTMATFIATINGVNAVWTLDEVISDATFVAVQGSSFDFKVNGVSISGGPFQYTTDDPGSVAVGILAINAARATHNYEAFEGTNSSHVGLRQRRGGLITGLPTVTVTGTAAVEGGGAITDFSGDTDTLTEIISGAAANLPTGTWEITANKALLDDYGDSLITELYAKCDVDIIAQRGRRRTATTGRTFLTADGEFDVPCVGLGDLDASGLLVSLGVWTVAGDGVLNYHMNHV